jgi:hypothetical protein
MRNYRRRRSLVNGIDVPQLQDKVKLLVGFQRLGVPASFCHAFFPWHHRNVHCKIRSVSYFDHEGKTANGRANC